MESSHPEDSKSSTEDSDKKDQVNDDAGTGRFYECVFCKRGFTTAQALGGHMNIHRRDKAKNKQPASSSSISKQSGVAHQDPDRPVFYSPAIETHKNPNIYFPSSDSRSTVQSQFKNPWDLNRIEEYPQTNLSLQTGSTDEDKENKKQTDKEEDELDLELRLGHDP